MSDIFTESEDFLESEIDLTGDDDALSGIVLLPTRIAFIDAAEAGQVEDYAARYQVTGLIPKGHESFKKLIAISDHIGRKVWGNEADAKLESCWSCIDNAIAPKNSNISIQDGDIHQTEYNSGNWWYKCSRRLDEGRPMIFDAEGSPIFEPNHLDDETGELVLGEMIGNEMQIPTGGDLAVVMIRVWAQKKQDRINFSLQGIRFQAKGGGAQRSIAAQGSTAAKLGGDAMPALAALAEGSGDTQSAPPKKAAAKKAPAKKAAKKGAAKKAAKSKGSVFKKRSRK